MEGGTGVRAPCPEGGMSEEPSSVSWNVTGWLKGRPPGMCLCVESGSVMHVLSAGAVVFSAVLMDPGGLLFYSVCPSEVDVLRQSACG